MKLDNSLFGITPKPFQTINIYPPRRKPPLMVHSQMPIATKHQGIITSKFIRIDNGSSSHFPDGHVQQRLRRHVLDHLHPHRPISLVNAENRDFPGCPSASLPFPSASKIGFIQLNFALEKSFFALAAQKGQTKYRDGSENSWITEANLLGNLPCREFHFKEFDNPEPFLIRDPELVNPSVREIMEAVFAPLTSIPFVGNSINFSAAATCTKNRVTFPTRFFEKKPSPIFRFCNKFKGLKFH